MQGKPGFSPPDYLPSRLRLFPFMHYFSLCPEIHIAPLYWYANRRLVNIAWTQKLSCMAGAEFCG